MVDAHTLVRTYDAETAPRGMWKHVLPLLRYPAVIWENRNLVANFTRREFLARYRGSTLGPAWVVIQPLLMFAIYYVVFGILFVRHEPGQSPDPNFAFYLFSGVTAFSTLNEATTTHCSSVVANGNLVKKVAFPSEVLLLPTTLVSMSTYLVGACVLLVAWLCCRLFGLELVSLQPGWLLLTIPLTMLVQFGMILGIGLFLANLYVFVRDVRQIWGIFTMVWMFLSPVFWSPDLVRNNLPGAAHLLFVLNPAYPLIQAQRQSLGAVDAVLSTGQHLQFGDFWQNLGLAAAWAAVFLVLGFSAFVSRKHKYADLV